jgi:hypothetical protein
MVFLSMMDQLVIVTADSCQWSARACRQHYLQSGGDFVCTQCVCPGTRRRV